MLGNSAVICIAVLWISVCSALDIKSNATSFTDYSAEQADIALWLSSATYCDKNDYKTRTFKGPTSGFVVDFVISEIKFDIQGFVGYLPSDKSIYVAFRGSSSIRNWIANIDVYKTDYSTFPECNCQVHKGFYEATKGAFPGVILSVTKLIKQHPDYTVKVTGHSLGAAVAQLTSLELKKVGIDTQVYNFGQPRTGDKAYSQFSTGLVPIWRITHNKDIVPHIPFAPVMDFYHVCREAFEDANGNVKVCDTSCEDASCADQYAFVQTNVDDHLTYLGRRLNCENVSL